MFAGSSISVQDWTAYLNITDPVAHMWTKRSSVPRHHGWSDDSIALRCGEIDEWLGQDLLPVPTNHHSCSVMSANIVLEHRLLTRTSSCQPFINNERNT